MNIVQGRRLRTVCLRLRAVAFAGFAVIGLMPEGVGQETIRASVDSSGKQGNSDSQSPVISADGQVVAFTSIARNLVPGDANGCIDVFVHELATGRTERVSVDSSGGEANAQSSPFSAPAVSSDGRFIAFDSYASNLVAGDTNRCTDVFVRDRATGVTERVSLDSWGMEVDGDSLYPSISADGRYVAFVSFADNLDPGDRDWIADVFVRDRLNGTTELVSVSSSGTKSDDYCRWPSISADGEVVAFASTSALLVSGDANGARDAFVHERSTGVTERISVDSSGGEGNADSSSDSPPALSATGAIVAFESIASNLVAGDANGVGDVFVRDRSAQTTERVSVDCSGTEGNSRSAAPSLSADGLVAAFHSFASNLVASDVNADYDVFVRDRGGGTTQLVSANSTGREGNDNSFEPSLTADGFAVAFWSMASNLVQDDWGGHGDVFVYEFCGVTAAWSNYGAGYPGTLGVPSFTSQSNPVIGTTVTLDLANSRGSPTVGLIIIGSHRTTIPSNRGGDLLVAPMLVVPISFWYGGDSFTGNLPDDWRLCGTVVDLQALEADPGAAYGVSFTEGLELLIGR